MKSPELMITGEYNELLNEFEPREHEVGEMADLAIRGLREFYETQYVGSLADAQAVLVENALYYSLKYGVELTHAVSSTVRKVREQMMDIARLGKHGFPVEEIGKQFGRTRELGILGECKYFSEALSDGEEIKIFTNGAMDTFFGIDAIKVYCRLNEDGDFEIYQIDLVQIKNDSRRVTDSERTGILSKHIAFKNKETVAIREIQEVLPDQVKIEALKNALGSENSERINTALFEVLTSGVDKESTEDLFLKELNSFKVSILKEKVFTKAQTATKRGYVEKLIINTNDIDDTNPEYKSLVVVFEKWRESWLSEMEKPTKKVPRIVPIETTRSVIFYGNDSPDIEVISA